MVIVLGDAIRQLVWSVVRCEGQSDQRCAKTKIKVQPAVWNHEKRNIYCHTGKSPYRWQPNQKTREYEIWNRFIKYYFISMDNSIHWMDMHHFCVWQVKLCDLKVDPLLMLVWPIVICSKTSDQGALHFEDELWMKQKEMDLWKNAFILDSTITWESRIGEWLDTNTFFSEQWDDLCQLERLNNTQQRSTSCQKHISSKTVSSMIEPVIRCEIWKLVCACEM